MFCITWSHILVFLLFHITTIASAGSSSSDSDSSKDSSSREKIVSRAQSTPEDERTKAERLDDNAVPSQNVVQAPEQAQTDLATLAPLVPPTLAPQPELHPSSSTSGGTGIPEPPNFHGFSFFIGFMTGFALLVIIVAGIRFWIHHRAERRIPYTIY